MNLGLHSNKKLNMVNKKNDKGVLTVLRRTRKAQSTLEYALLIGLVVGALLTMQNYLKRAIQGRMQVVGDQMGDQYSPNLTYRREYMEVSNDRIEERTVPGSRGLGELVTAGGPATTSTNITGGHQESEMTKRVQPLDQETWPE